MRTEAERKARIKDRNAPKPPPPHPYYDAFVQQLSAMVILTRLMHNDKSYSVPSAAQRFYDEYGRKTV